MVRRPSLSRPFEEGATRDDHGGNARGVVPITERDRLDEKIAYDGRHSDVPVRAERVAAARAAEQATARREAARRAADQVDSARLAAVRRSEAPMDGHAADTGAAPETLDREVEPSPPLGPRPRASVLATLSLVTGVVAAIAVLTGALAGYGAALGVLALLLSIGGFSATARRHVAGRSLALLGLILGLGAVVVGILALAGALSWLSTDSNTVDRIGEWLSSHFRAWR